MRAVAGSSYHVGGGFLVDGSGRRPRVFVQFGAQGLWFDDHGPPQSRSDDLLAVNFGPHDLRPYGGGLEEDIQLLDKGGRMRSIFGIDTAHCGGWRDLADGDKVVETLRARANLPRREGLIEAGFVPVVESGRSGVYRYMAGPNEVLATISNNRITGVFHESDLDPNLVRGTAIKGVHRFTIRDRMRRTKVHYTGLAVAKDWIEYTLIPGISATVYPERVRHLREPRNAEIGLRRVPVSSSQGFRIGAPNDTATVRTTRRINGIAVDELARRMRSSDICGTGFIGADDDLVDLLARDNDVVRGAGSTHGDIAEPLRKIVQLNRLGFLSGPEHDRRGVEIFLGGQPYRVQTRSWMGSWDSPFDDGTSSSVDFYLYNPRTGKRLFFPGILGEMAARYGFYSRLAPEDIIRFFDHLRDRAPDIDTIVASVDANMGPRLVTTKNTSDHNVIN